MGGLGTTAFEHAAFTSRYTEICLVTPREVKRDEPRDVRGRRNLAARARREVTRALGAIRIDRSKRRFTKQHVGPVRKLGQAPPAAATQAGIDVRCIGCDPGSPAFGAG